jgi:hypothetical protein
MMGRRYKKPVERLTGQNYGICHQIVDRMSVGTPYLEAVRRVWRKLKLPKDASPALRRGLILEVLSRHSVNRELYNRVAGSCLPVLLPSRKGRKRGKSK